MKITNNEKNTQLKNSDIFEKNLAYYTPKHGGPKQSIRVPQCHSLYVCPLSCGRRIAIRAIKNGDINKISFLYINQADVISGDYENKIAGAIKDILDILEDKPKAFVIYVNCIDDFLGTDEIALVQHLRESFPHLKFTICHINPVSDDEGIPRGMLMYDRLYGFLQEKIFEDSSANLIANFVSIDKNSEFYDVLKSFGITKINELFNLETFEEYENMANSKLNIVHMVMGKLAGETLRKKFGTPCLFLPPSYDVQTVTNNYNLIGETLNKQPLDFSEEISKTQEVINKTLATVGNMPIIVDTFATMLPFALAKTLAGYGFNVCAVFATHAKDTDREDLEYITQHYKNIKIIKGLDYKEVLSCNLDKNCIAIGFDGAYTIKAEHFVDIRHDESFYGFYGIRKLMDLICEAYNKKTIWE